LNAQFEEGEKQLPFHTARCYERKKKKGKKGKNRQAVNSERKKFPVGDDMRLKRTLNLLYVHY